MKKYTSLLILIIVLFGCNKYEAEEFYPTGPKYVGDPIIYDIKGEWILTSAKRVTTHKTTQWTDSLNYFWYSYFHFIPLFII